MERTTVSLLRDLTERLATVTGYPIELDRMNPGDGATYALETPNGTRPFGERRLRAGEMREALYMALKVAYRMKENS